MIRASLGNTITSLEDVLAGADADSIVSMTAISARTIYQIGRRASSGCLPAVEKAAGINATRIDKILASHCVDLETLRADRCWPLYAAPTDAPLARIEAACGKTITREPELFRAAVVPQRHDEGPEEWDAEELLEEVAP